MRVTPQINQTEILTMFVTKGKILSVEDLFFAQHPQVFFRRIIYSVVNRENTPSM